MVETNTLQKRTAIARRIAEVKRTVAEEVTEKFFVRHPDWLERYGERGRRRGIEDAKYHLDFLASAIESGSTASFEDYARWTSRMLSARGIAPHFVAENFQQLEESLRRIFTDDSIEMIALFIKAGRDACLEKIEDNQAENQKDSDSELSQAQRIFLESILKGQRRTATAIAMEAIRNGSSIVDVYTEIFQESQYQLGRLWESNKITIAEEHMATAITQFVMAQIYPLIETTDTVRGKMVITGVEGEMHQIGANMVADVLETKGWDVRFLGTNMPHQGILKAVEEHQADVVGISATMLFSIPKVAQIIHQLRETFGSDKQKIIVGGACFRQVPHLFSEIGADGFAADLKTVLSLLE
jgi:methanogenic corrinoid protein MtbC1